MSQLNNRHDEVNNTSLSSVISHNHNSNAMSEGSLSMEGSHDVILNANDADMRVEAIHLAQVVASFKNYSIHCFNDIKQIENSLGVLRPNQNALLRKAIEERIRLKREGVLQTSKLLNLIIKHSNSFVHELLDRANVSIENAEVSPANYAKMISTIKQLMRDWSIEGAEERAQSYQLLVDDLCELYPHTSERSCIRVLTPGAGLGRLTWEIARQGFSSQGNEFSYFMLLASQYILNQTSSSSPIAIHPFVLDVNNCVSGSSTCRRVLIPDVEPSDIGCDAELSMVAGEFLEVYGGQASSWHAVVTNFFIDTAHNIADYIEAIAHILKPGGYWINLGPLLYHFSDMPNEPSIELTYEEVSSLFAPAGFTLIKEERQIQCHYCRNVDSMMQVSYQCIHFICQKQTKETT